MSLDSENQSYFLSNLLKHLNQTNSDSLETLERENLHFIITDHLIATFEEIKCDIFLAKHHAQAGQQQQQQQQLQLQQSHQQSSSSTIITSPDEVNDGEGETPTTLSSGSSSVPSSYQDGINLSSSDWLSSGGGVGSGSNGGCGSGSGGGDQRNSESDVFSPIVDTDSLQVSKIASKYETGLTSFSESISNLSEISSCVALDLDNKTGTEMSSLGRLDNTELADSSAESVAVQLLTNYSQKPLFRRSSLQPLTMSSPTSSTEPRTSTKSLPIRRSGSSCYSLFSNTSPIVTNHSSFQSLSTSHLQAALSSATRSSSSSSNIKLRGNSHWAPLRPQLICNIQRPTDKFTQWHNQNQRCAGCGLQIDSKSKEFHGILFCYYTGKFFCRLGCHSGRKAILPAFVLHKWDFTYYPISNFAVKFLEKIREEPLFHINDQNPSLYKRVKQLNKLLDLRYQLKSLMEYISTCKNATESIHCFNSFEPQHFIKNDINLYSLEDFITIKRSKKLLESCWSLVKESINHVSRCDYCKARGYFCELCNKKDVLFPFEIGRIHQCAACHTCYHLFCYNHQANQKCSKCCRIQARRSIDSQYNSQQMKTVNQSDHLVTTSDGENHLKEIPEMPENHYHDTSSFQPCLPSPSELSTTTSTTKKP